MSTPTMQEHEAFDSWAIVEVMGHNTFAGRVTEQVVAGCAFVRVDVPEIPASTHYAGRPAFTKLIGTASIYSLTPCTEAVAVKAAQRIRATPLTTVDISTQAAIEAPQESLRWPDDSNDDEDDDV
jgi:hypothetical protein